MSGLLSEQQAVNLVKAIAVTRLGLGAACLVAPSLARVWLGRGGNQSAAKVLSRSLAGRDLALGYGTVRAKSGTLRTWALLSAFADAVDMAGTMAAYSDLPKVRRALVALVSLSATLADGVAALSLPTAAEFPYP